MYNVCVKSLQCDAIDTNDYRSAPDRVVRESGTYYRTQINVKGEGVQAFYRAGFMGRR